MAAVAEETDVKWEIAEKIFREVIRPQLTEADKGKFISINVKTGQWAMDKENMVAYQKGKALWGEGKGSQVIGLRAGYLASYSFRPGLNLEIDEW